MPHRLAALAALVLSGFVSSMSVQAAAPVAVDLTPGYDFSEFTGPGVVGAGQVATNGTLFYIDEQLIDGLKSWFVFYEGSGISGVQATLRFDAPIVNVFTRMDTLEGSNGFRSSAIQYSYLSFTGIEGRDFVSFEQGSRTLRLSFHTLIPGDHIRILTAIPEPGTTTLMAGGLAALLWLARRRRSEH